MSVGPTALSSLLVQRLDAVLGTQLAQQGPQTATRQDAVIPPGGADALRRDPQGRGGDQIEGLSGRERAALREAAEQAELAAALRSRFVSTSTTPSAPTTLGQTARVILTLLAQYPQTAPALAGKAPLWQGATDGDTAGGAQAAMPRAVHGGTPPGQAGAPAGHGAGDDAAQDAAGRQGAAGTAAGAGRGAGAGAPAPSTAPGGAAAEAPDTARTGAPAAGDGGTQGARHAEAARVTALGTPGPQPGPLAQALRQAIETSGVFYESHLGDVAFGKRAADQVRGEPQAALDAEQAPPISTPVPKQSILAENARFNLPTHAAPTMPQADGMPSTGTAPTWSASTPAHPPAPPPGIHPDAALLVRQQLEVLANQTLAWEGTAWPGTEMWWEIRRDAGDEQPAAAEQAAWATRLVLTMPRLGTVEARISLSGQRLGLHIVAPESDGEIAAAGHALRKRLESAGLELAQMTVSAHAPAPEPLP